MTRLLTKGTNDFDVDDNPTVLTLATYAQIKTQHCHPSHSNKSPIGKKGTDLPTLSEFQSAQGTGNCFGKTPLTAEILCSFFKPDENRQLVRPMGLHGGVWKDLPQSMPRSILQLCHDTTLAIHIREQWNIWTAARDYVRPHVSANVYHIAENAEIELEWLLQLIASVRNSCSLYMGYYSSSQFKFLSDCHERS